MRAMTSLLTGVAILGAALGAVPASAQTAPVTFVSRAGTNSGDCSASPCRTLAYAFTQTIANGRIVCEGAGPYAPVTITRSVTIDCTGSTAVLRLENQNFGIKIDDSATAAPGTIEVIIRGLAIDGVGVAEGGIVFRSGFSLTVDGVSVTARTSGAASNGILFAPGGAARLLVSNSFIGSSGGSNGAGIGIFPQTPGYASVVLDNVVLSGNRAGLIVSTGGNSAPSSTNVVMNRAVISGSAGDGVGAFAFAPAGVGVTITNSSIGGNAGNGILANGANASVRVENSTIAGNSTGLSTASGAIIASYGNNSLIGNGVNGSFNGFPSEN